MSAAPVAAVPEARWLGVELRHLVALRAVAQGQSFKYAARRLGYSQSAVSQQIAMLERLTGQTLVQRSAGGRSVSLTDAGRLLLEHAEAITARIAAAKADLDALAVGKAGTLRIGAPQTAGTRILAEALTRLLTREPGISIDLRESTADLELLEQLERGVIDVTVAVLPLPDGPFEWAELHVDPFAASVSAHSPLAGRGEVSLEQLCRLPLVCFRSCRMTQIALDHLRAEGVEPNIVFRSDQAETIHAAVAAGVANAFLPSLCTDERDGHTRKLRIVPEVPPRVIAAVWCADRDLAPPAAALVAAARDVCAKLAPTARAC